MKKVVLSSVVALSLFALAVPAFAADGATNEYLAGHSGEIGAEAAQDPAVVAAKKELDAVEGGSHLYGEKKAAYESAYNDAFNTVRNKYVKQFQGTYNNATEQQGQTYKKGQSEADKNKAYLERVGAANNQPGQAGQNVKPGANAQNPASKEEAAKTESKNGAKAGQKPAGKALPKTSAVK